MVNIYSCQPPQDRYICKFLPLTKSVLVCVALFCSYEVNHEQQHARGKSADAIIFGTPAVQLRFKMLKGLAQSGASIVMQSLRLVKQSKWVLEDHQKLLFAKGLKNAVPAHIALALALTAGKADDEGECAIVAASSVASMAPQASSADSSARSASKQKGAPTAAVSVAKQAILAKLSKH